MAKQWWQSDKKTVKPWVIDLRRDPCDDSQWAPLRQSGYSKKQGPTHYCPICRWAFWPVKFTPTISQVEYQKLTDPNASIDSMSYIKMCNKPSPRYGQTVEYTMMQQLANLSPDFLTHEIKEYWQDKYCKKYPSTELAKRRKAFKKWYKEQMKQHYNI